MAVPIVECDSVLLVFGAHLYGATGRRVAQRIAQQVDQHLDDPVGLGLHN